MSSLPTLPQRERHRYDPVGICIYCGSDAELTDEHIIPFGLGGNLVLPASSCRECAKATSRFERTVLRGPLRPVRIARGIQSRRKHRGAPTQLPLQVRFDGKDWETVWLSFDDYPILLEFFLYDVPGFLDPDEYRTGTRVHGQATFSFGPRPEAVLKSLGAKQLRIPKQYVPSDFAKMTAKVAYSMAVAEKQIDPHRGRPEVVSSILSVEDDIGRWVGAFDEPRRVVPGATHLVYVERNTDLGLLMGRVQYLADIGTPIYSVILGRLNDGFVTPDLI